MNCFEAQDKIIDLVLNQLSDGEIILLQQHLDECPICHEEFQLLDECLQICTDKEGETCLCQFQETYWEDFVVSVHEKIRYEKPERQFPYHIVVPIAVSILAAISIGYFVFFRPELEETVQEAIPEYEYDPYEEIYELSPEETEEFIKMINHRYGGE